MTTTALLLLSMMAIQAEEQLSAAAEKPTVILVVGAGGNAPGVGNFSRSAKWPDWATLDGRGFLPLSYLNPA